MNEIDSSETEYQATIDEQKELQKLLWEQLENDEKVIMKVYLNNIMNDKKINVSLMNQVNIIMGKYPGFDIECVQ